MCKFLSCLLLENGDIIAAPEYTDSHENLIAYVKIHDQSVSPKFARIEFTPPTDSLKIGDLSAWEFGIDQDITPPWLDDEKRAAAREKLERNVAQMFVTDKRDLLLGGCWILLGGSQVGKAIRCKLAIMSPDSYLAYASGVLVGSMLENSSVGAMWENSSVKTMLGNSSVETMRENSSVGAMWENSSVKTMLENSSVKTMRENSSVGAMWENSSVKTMLGNSSVETMWENSSVETMWENSSVGAMRENSSVKTMRENSSVGAMWENSSVKTDLRKKGE